MVKAKLLAVVADEVEDREDRLVPRAAEPAAQLLEEDGGAFGRPEEQDGVDVGDVEPLVEQVGRKEDVDTSRPKSCERFVAFRASGVDR